MIQHIQILRCFAALAVVLHHARPPVIPAAMFSELPPWLNVIAAMGFTGVDVFFVISGAIMAETTRHLEPGVGTAAKFVSTRFLRIYSGWWPFFFIYLSANFFLRNISEEKNLIASFFLFPQNINHQLLPIVWTLCFELYFYITLGILLIFPKKIIHITLALLATSIAIFTIFNWQNELYKPSRFGEVSQLHDFYTSPLVLEFLAGFFICNHIRKNPNINWILPASIGVILFTFATWYQLNGNLNASGMAGFHHLPERTLLLGGFSCCLLACALLWNPPAGKIANLFSKLGDASYSIYLSHIAVIYAISLILMRLGKTERLSSIFLILTIVAFVSLYSWLHYQWIEKPFYKALRSGLPRVSSRFASNA